MVAHTRERSVWELMQELQARLLQVPMQAKPTQRELAIEWLEQLAKRAREEEDRWYQLGQHATQLAERVEDAAC